MHVSVRDEWVWMCISVCTSHRCDSERLRVTTVSGCDEGACDDSERVRVMTVSVCDEGTRDDSECG